MFEIRGKRPLTLFVLPSLLFNFYEKQVSIKKCLIAIRLGALDQVPPFINLQEN